MRARLVVVILLLVSLKSRGDGIPTMSRLRYTGALFGPSGTPLAGTQVISVSLWNLAAGGTTTANRRCETRSGPGFVIDSSGRFEIELEAGCLDAIRQSTDLWVEVTVNGVALPRTKLGAVAYAVQSAQSATTSQIVTGNVTLNVGASAPFQTITAALRSLDDKVIRGRVTIQVADGSYAEPGALVVDHPDAKRIRIRGNSTNAAAVIVNFTSPGALSVGPASALGGIEGLTLRRPAVVAAQNVGINVWGSSFASLGPNLRLEGFNFGVQVELASSIDATGVTVVGAGANDGAGITMSSSSGGYINQSSVSQTGTAYGSFGASFALVNGSSAQNANEGWRSNDNASMGVGSVSAFSGLTTTFFAAGAGVLRAPTPLPAGANVFPTPLGMVGGQNAYIFQ